MQRNTVTTLGELRIGDRFHFLKRVDVWEITGKTRSHNSINLPGLNGVFINKYDDLKKSSTPVVFMRHTIPEPGEECIFSDLKYGDIFHLPDNVINEYIITKGGCVQGVNCIYPATVSGTDKVIFVRKKYSDE